LDVLPLNQHQNNEINIQWCKAPKYAKKHVHHIHEFIKQKHRCRYDALPLMLQALRACAIATILGAVLARPCTRNSVNGGPIFQTELYGY